MITDSGSRTEYSTGAVRNIKTENGRCDLMPLKVVSYFEKSDFLKCIGNFQETKKIINLYVAVKSFIEEAFHGDNETAFLELSLHFKEGAEKYGENNWQKGIPPKSYIDSAVRHYLKFKRGDSDENHDRAVIWNLLCCIWTIENAIEVKENEK